MMGIVLGIDRAERTVRAITDTGAEIEASYLGTPPWPMSMAFFTDEVLPICIGPVGDRRVVVSDDFMIGSNFSDSADPIPTVAAGFETGVGAWTNVTQSNTVARTGTYSGRHATTNAWSEALLTVTNPTPSVESWYLVSVWVRSADSHIVYLEINGARITTEWALTVDTWTKIECWGHVDPGSDLTIGVNCVSNVAPASFVYIDDVVATPYSEGIDGPFIPEELYVPTLDGLGAGLVAPRLYGAAWHQDDTLYNNTFTTGGYSALNIVANDNQIARGGEWDAAANTFVLPDWGCDLVEVECRVAIEADTTGRRQLKIGITSSVLTERVVASPQAVATVPTILYGKTRFQQVPGESIYFELFQSSGISLDQSALEIWVTPIWEP